MYDDEIYRADLLRHIQDLDKIALLNIHDGNTQTLQSPPFSPLLQTFEMVLWQWSNIPHSPNSARPNLEFTRL